MSKKIDLNTIDEFILVVNLLMLLGVTMLLILAQTLQIILNEVPCPLCLLQRIGFIGVIFGCFLNLKYGSRHSHYAIICASAIYTSFVALRQIALHILPDTGSYGNAILGLHLYTWSYIAAIVVLCITIILMSFGHQYKIAHRITKPWARIITILFTIIGVVVFINFVGVILECGLQVCPDNPTSYRLLSGDL